MLIYNPTTKISPHFTHREIVKSTTATRLLIDNTPNTIVLEAAKLLAYKILEPIRIEYGRSFSPNSWFRGEELEKAITKRGFETWCNRKGLPVNDDSWAVYFARKSHPKGEAADIEITGIANDDLYNWVDNNLEYDQLIREFPKPGDPQSGWVHVSFRKEGNRKQAFTIG